MAFSKDDQKDLCTIMNTKYAALLEERRFQMVTAVEKDSVSATVTLENSDESFHYPVEARMMLKQNGKTLVPFDGLTVLVDAIDAYFEDYLNGGEETFLPIDWADFTLEDMQYQLRGQVINRKLEQLGDDWLKLHDTPEASAQVEAVDHGHCQH